MDGFEYEPVMAVAGAVGGITADLTASHNAVELVRPASGVFGDKGGGLPNMAQAGGPDGTSGSQMMIRYWVSPPACRWKILGDTDWRIL
ncbi:MAG: hypothetical protein FWD68_04225 [Alphaproteobacteria bacterium]|nr:hypothetical protein [Alphaproteobacteria bacterium]